MAAWIPVSDSVVADGEATFSARVATQAAAVRPLRILLTILAMPFYVLGALVGLLFLAALWAVGAARVGFADVRDRLTPASPAAPAPAPPADEGIL